MPLKREFETGNRFFDEIPIGVLANAVGNYVRLRGKGMLDLLQRTMYKEEVNPEDALAVAMLGMGRFGGRAYEPGLLPAGLKPWNFKTTGWGAADQWLKEGAGFRGIKGKARVTWMKPKTFFDALAARWGQKGEEHMRDILRRDPDLVEVYKEAMQAGDKFPILVLAHESPSRRSVPLKSGKVYGHEGRHRTLAAAAAGEEEVPVLVLRSNPYASPPMTKSSFKLPTPSEQARMNRATMPSSSRPVASPSSGLPELMTESERMKTVQDLINVYGSMTSSERRAAEAGALDLLERNRAAAIAREMRQSAPPLTRAKRKMARVKGQGYEKYTKGLNQLTDSEYKAYINMHLAGTPFEIK